MYFKFALIAIHHSIATLLQKSEGKIFPCAASDLAKEQPKFEVKHLRTNSKMFTVHSMMMFVYNKF
jgi:hypothetical protein